MFLSHHKISQYFTFINKSNKFILLSVLIRGLFICQAYQFVDNF